MPDAFARYAVAKHEAANSVGAERQQKRWTKMIRKNRTQQDPVRFKHDMVILLIVRFENESTEKHF